MRPVFLLGGIKKSTLTHLLWYYIQSSRAVLFSNIVTYVLGRKFPNTISLGT